jgi:hypothetical protein
MIYPLRCVGNFIATYTTRCQLERTTRLALPILIQIKPLTAPLITVLETLHGVICAKHNKPLQATLSVIILTAGLLRHPIGKNLFLTRSFVLELFKCHNAYCSNNPHTALTHLARSAFWGLRVVLILKSSSHISIASTVARLASELSGALEDYSSTCDKAPKHLEILGKCILIAMSSYKLYRQIYTKNLPMPTKR